MTKIIRKRHFFRQYTNLILGVLWLSIGVGYFWIGEIEEFNFLFVFNLFLGLAYLTLHLLQKDRNQEFIAWDEEQVILSKWQLKPETYSIAQISRVKITNSYFILNTNLDAPGETMELSGYSEKDIDLLKQRFSDQQMASA